MVIFIITPICYKLFFSFYFGCTHGIWNPGSGIKFQLDIELGPPQRQAGSLTYYDTTETSINCLLLNNASKKG